MNKVKSLVISGHMVFAGVIFILANTALANDGFYQGSGSTLRLAKNSYLRVHKENLLIIPINPPECYSVYANGKELKEGMDLKIDEAKVTIGARTKCNGTSTDMFSAKWRVVADYQVVVLQSQQRVSIGFPVDTWRRDFIAADGDLYYLYPPGVVNFRTYINDEEIKPLELKKLRSHNDKTGSRDELGYTWSASFEKGKSYRLRTEYDLGVNNGNAFYKGREYLSGETPWFSGVMPEPFPAERIIYFLTPINSWAAPPPEQIKIEVRLPTEIPVTYLVPLELKPACVTSKALHYLLKNKFPSNELSLSMPSSGWLNAKKESLKPLRTLGQWKRWQKTLGGETVKIGCDAIEELKKSAEPDLQAHMSAYQCAVSCGE